MFIYDPINVQSPEAHISRSLLSLTTPKSIVQFPNSSWCATGVRVLNNKNVCSSENFVTTVEFNIRISKDYSFLTSITK